MFKSVGLKVSITIWFY